MTSTPTFNARDFTLRGGVGDIEDFSTKDFKRTSDVGKKDNNWDIDGVSKIIGDENDSDYNSDKHDDIFKNEIAELLGLGSHDKNNQPYDNTDTNTQHLIDLIFEEAKDNAGNGKKTIEEMKSSIIAVLERYDITDDSNYANTENDDTKKNIDEKDGFTSDGLANLNGMSADDLIAELKDDKGKVGHNIVKDFFEGVALTVDADDADKAQAIRQMVQTVSGRNEVSVDELKQMMAFFNAMTETKKVIFAPEFSNPLTEATTNTTGDTTYYTLGKINIGTDGKIYEPTEDTEKTDTDTEKTHTDTEKTTDLETLFGAVDGGGDGEIAYAGAADLLNKNYNSDFTADTIRKAITDLDRIDNGTASVKDLEAVIQNKNLKLIQSYTQEDALVEVKEKLGYTGGEFDTNKDDYDDLLNNILVNTFNSSAKNDYQYSEQEVQVAAEIAYTILDSYRAKGKTDFVADAITSTDGIQVKSTTEVNGRVATYTYDSNNFNFLNENDVDFTNLSESHKTRLENLKNPNEVV